MADSRVADNPTSATEVKIWLLALVAPLLLVVLGFAAGHLRYGLFVVCGAAIVDALALIEHAP